MADVPGGRKSSSIDKEAYGEPYWQKRRGRHLRLAARDDPLIEELIPRPLQIKKKQARPSDSDMITGTANTSGAEYNSTSQEGTPFVELETLLSSTMPDARHAECYWNSGDWNRFKHLSSVSTLWSGQPVVSQVPSGSPRINTVVTPKRSMEILIFPMDDLCMDEDHSAGPEAQLQMEPHATVENSSETNAEPKEWDVSCDTYNQTSSTRGMHTERPAMDIEPLLKIRRWIQSHEKRHSGAISGHSISSIEDDNSGTLDTPIGGLIRMTKDQIKQSRTDRGGPVETAGGGSFGPLKMEFLEEYVKLLGYLDKQGEDLIYDEGDVQPEPGVLSAEQMCPTNELTNRWVRENLDKKFKHMCKVTLREERHRLRLATIVAQKNGDTERERSLLLEKQRLKRQAFADCRSELLLEVRQMFKRDISQDISEIEDLYRLRRGQEVLRLNQRNACMVAYWEVFDKTQRSVTISIERNMPLLEIQLGAISSILELGLKPVAAVPKCIDRLSAKDIRDPAKREIEKQKRLAEPDAIEYLLKASENAAFLQQWSRTVYSAFEDIEQQLSELSQLALDRYMALDAWIAFVDWKEGNVQFQVR